MNLLPPKKDVALAFLERGLVRVFLDPRPKEVVVPPHFKKQPQLILDIGLNLPIPIPDLQVDEAGITCTLSFDRPYHAFYCVLPWSSVFALVGDGQRSMIWPDDVPVEIQLSVRPAKPAAPEREAPKLSVVPPSGESSSDKPEKAEKAEKRKAKRAAKKAELRVAPPAPESTPAVAPAPAPVVARAAAPVVAPAPAMASAPGPSSRRDDSDDLTSDLPPPPSKKKRELPPYLRVVK